MAVNAVDKAPPLFVGCNWKGCLQDPEAVSKLIRDVNEKWDKQALRDVELCVFPPYLFIDAVRKELDETLTVGSQSVWEAKDSLALNTGSVSAKMLAGVGCKWVLLGHADRRHTLGETDGLIAAKVGKCLEAGLCVNLTIGDTAEVRAAGKTDECLVGQLSAAAAEIPNDSWGKLCVAYEPVWAVGEGAKPCSPDEAQRVLAMLRSWVADSVSTAAGQAVRLVYTGSVNAENAASYAVLPDNNGFVVGRAGLDANKLLEICSTLATCKAQSEQAMRRFDVPPEIFARIQSGEAVSEEEIRKFSSKAAVPVIVQAASGTKKKSKKAKVSKKKKGCC